MDVRVWTAVAVVVAMDRFDDAFMIDYLLYRLID